MTIAVSIIAFVLLKEAPKTNLGAAYRWSLRSVGPFPANRNFRLVTGCGFGASWGFTGFIFRADALIEKGLGFSGV